MDTKFETIFAAAICAPIVGCVAYSLFLGIADLF